MGANATYNRSPYFRQEDGALVLRSDGRLVSEDELWGDCPLANWLLDPSIGVHLIEDWQSYDPEATNGDWVLTQATAGAAAISTAKTGVLELDSNSTTQAQGAQIQRVKSAFVPVAGKNIWFEVPIKIVDTFDKAQLFVGLSEIDTTLIAAGANSSANHIGWEVAAAGAGVLSFAGEKAGTRGTKAAATLLEDTYVRLGFKVVGVTSIQQYINGVAVGTPIETANVPIVAVYPSFVCQSDGTNDPIMHIGPMRVFQEW